MPPARVEPEITVVIPTFDRGAVVLAAVQSVLDQAGPTVEVIVVDDGSTDDTARRVGDHPDPRVRLVQAAHVGVCTARNLGAAAARSPWLTFLDSDDLAADGWLVALTAPLARGAALVTCGAELRYPDGRVRVVRPMPLGPAFGSITAHFLAGTFAVSTELFRAVGGYREGLGYGENTELGMRLGTEAAARGARVASDPRTLVHVSAVDRSYDARRYFESGVVVLRETGDLLAKDPRLHASYLAITGVAASRDGRGSEAQRLLWRAWTVEPRNWRHAARLARSLAPMRSLR